VKAILLLLLCGTAAAEMPLARARHAFKTKIFNPKVSREEAADPPPEIFEKVKYPARLGKNVAYVTPLKNGAKRPAIVWIHGGMDWAIGEGQWANLPRTNEQTARVFRESGIVMMVPSLRGSNRNPGRNECFLGEIDDVIAAADWLAKRKDVDPKRIYLGGHSTGGTIALLTAESTRQFRAVFAFGPVSSVRMYGDAGCLPADVTPAEAKLRAPVEFIQDIVTPTYVIEGGARGNGAGYLSMMLKKAAAPVQFFLVPSSDHFTVLGPGSEVVARAILADTGPQPKFDITLEKIQQALDVKPKSQ
jgi:acetyl esterase/lipase